MRTREVLVAAAIGIAAGFVALIGWYSTSSPQAFAISALTSYWYVGLIALLAGWILGDRRPGHPIPRVLSVVGAAWVGFTTGSVLLAVLMSYQRGY